MDNKKKQPLNNQQLTDAVIDHELRIANLEFKKKKPPRDGNKPPKITIADVMKTLVDFQTSVNKSISNLSERVSKIENEVFKK